jgi:hypothetical protein
VRKASEVIDIHRAAVRRAIVAPERDAKTGVRSCSSKNAATTAAARGLN